MKITKEDLKTLETLKKKNSSWLSPLTSQFNSIVDKVNAYVANYNKDFQKFIANKRIELSSLKTEIANYEHKKVNETSSAEQEKRSALVDLANTLENEGKYLNSDDFKNGHMY